MQITRLLIENLRAIERLELKLADDAGQPRRRLVLLGVNGAGKTTVLDAVAHAFDVLEGSDDDGKPLRAGDVRNTEAPSLEAEAPVRRGVISVGAVLSDEERRACRLIYPEAPASGTLHYEIGADLNGDDALLPDMDELRLPLSTDVFGVEQEQDDSPISFEGAAHAAFASTRAPCILLPADRGVLEPSDDLTLREIRMFDPSVGCRSRSRGRFAAVAAHLALASTARESEATRSVERMWKVLSKYFPALPQPGPRPDGLSLQFRNERGAIIPLTALSEGERAILLIFGELALRSPKDGLVLVDELEQHLHPRWQKAALEGLVALLPTAQFIVTTQSPYVAACAPDDVVELGDWSSHGE